MQQSEFTIEYGRQVLHREWRHTDGQRHRTTGPAVEHWTALPGGAHVLAYQAWYVNGKAHREGRPATRQWHVADDGTRILMVEEWIRHTRGHRMNGPSWRSWHVEPDGTRTLTWKHWCVNGKLHRADGPAHTGHGFYWHDKAVKSEDLPWLRRRQGLLTALAAVLMPTHRNDTAPAWSRDGRVTTVTWHGGGAMPVYRSAVGGSVLLCV